MSLSAHPRPPSAATSRWRSLELRLALAGALLIALAVTLTALLATRTAGARTEQLVLDQSLAQTRRLASFLSARLVGFQLSLRAVSERLDVSQQVDRAAAARLLAESVALTTQVSTLFVADPTGRVLALWDGDKGVHHPPLAIGDRAYFRLTVEQQRPVISEPVMGRLSGQPVVVLTMPVRGPRGDVIAVVGGGVRLANPQWLLRLTSDDQDDPSLLVIADAQGRVLAHPQAARLMHDVSHEESLEGAAARWIAQGRPAEPEGDVGRFGEHLVAWAGVPDAEWVVFRSVPAQAALAGARAARDEALWLGVAVAAIGGLALLVTTSWLLRPLRQLERSALAVFNGASVDDAQWPHAGGEIGRLADALRGALSARQRADAEGRVVVARLQAVREHAPVGFSITRSHCFDLVSAHFERLLGWPPGALDGQRSRLIYASDEVYEGLGPRVGAAFRQRQAFDEELEFVRRDGQRFWGRLRGQPVDWDDASAGTIWTLEDVSRQRSEREQLAWASSHDTLTRLANRAAFERALAAALAERRGRPAAALFIDLDRFKAVNDTAGHAAGDAVLQAVADALQSQVRHNDLVARLGGDEFAVLLPACDREGAVRVAEKMRAAVNAVRVRWAERELDVGCSIGVVEVDTHLPDLAAVMAAADQACYAAKHSGRDCVRVYGEAVLRVV
jgi:diguanylate cyclase (GGDEF)-like protein/PAS domain S-box-containing protein